MGFVSFNWGVSFRARKTVFFFSESPAVLLGTKLGNVDSPIIRLTVRTFCSTLFEIRRVPGGHADTSSASLSGFVWQQ